MTTANATRLFLAPQLRFACFASCLFGAGYRVRTGDNQLGKLGLYQLS